MNLGSRLDLGHRHGQQLVHLGADIALGGGLALGREVLQNLVQDVVVAGFLEIGGHHLLGIGVGGIARDAELLGSPQAEQLVPAGFRLELQLLVEGELLLETFLALVELVHGRSSNPC